VAVKPQARTSTAPDAGVAIIAAMPNDELVHRIREALARSSEGLVAAFLFGSHAAGRAHRESDVDIGVLLDREALPTVRARFERGLELATRLQGALGGAKVDLVVLNDSPPHLGRRIVTTGCRLVDREPGRTHAFVRDVQLRAADLEPFLRRTRAVKLGALSR
jgi:predicted nucleotidyltransferase